jgi:hypothetical protein
MKESNIGLYTAGTIVSLALLGAFIALSVVIGEDFAVPAMVVGGVMGLIVLRGPVGKALAERIHAGTVSRAEPSPELLDEMYEMRTRMLELEERVDFTERLLATTRDQAAQLPPT